ncbi:MAG: ATP-binding protein [Candidatus Paceibacterota bacterium]|jgi:signal transduction histidine kinase
MDPCTEEEKRHFLKQIEVINKRMKAQLDLWKVCEAGGCENSWYSLGEIYNYCKGFFPTIEISFSDEMKGIKIYASSLIVKVLENLIDNTKRHGEKATKIEIDYSIDAAGDLLIIYEDNGIGIEYKNKELIFGRGFGNNTGMGLFLIKEILDITDIKISENGKPGEGARFEIKVPKNYFKI